MIHPPDSISGAAGRGATRVVTLSPSLPQPSQPSSFSAYSDYSSRTASTCRRHNSGNKIHAASHALASVEPVGSNETHHADGASMMSCMPLQAALTEAVRRELQTTDAMIRHLLAQQEDHTGLLRRHLSVSDARARKPSPGTSYSSRAGCGNTLAEGAVARNPYATSRFNGPDGYGTTAAAAGHSAPSGDATDSVFPLDEASFRSVLREELRDVFASRSKRPDCAFRSPLEDDVPGLADASFVMEKAGQNGVGEMVGLSAENIAEAKHQTADPEGRQKTFEKIVKEEKQKDGKLAAKSANRLPVEESLKRSESNSSYAEAAQAAYLLDWEHGSKRIIYSIFGKWIDQFMKMEEPPRTGSLARIATSHRFECVCTAVIVANSIFMWILTDWEGAHPGEKPAMVYRWTDAGFLLFYLFELLLKMSVHRGFFFINENYRWNMFDFMLVVMSCIDQVAGYLFNLTFMRTLRILRVAKILRVFRLMHMLAELRLILNSLMGSVGSLSWSIVMMLLILYMFGVCFVQGAANFLGSNHGLSELEVEELDALFGSVSASILSLFKATTGGEDWAVFYKVLLPLGTLYAFIYLFFVAFTQIAFMNILTGLFIENAIKLAQPDRDALALRHRKEQLSHVRELTRLCEEMDMDGDEQIETEQFFEMMGNRKVSNYLSVLGLDVKDAEVFYKMLLECSPDGKVSIKDFVDGCMKMRGEASAFDLQSLLFECKGIARRQEIDFGAVNEAIHDIRTQLNQRPPGLRNIDRGGVVGSTRTTAGLST